MTWTYIIRGGQSEWFVWHQMQLADTNPHFVWDRQRLAIWAFARKKWLKKEEILKKFMKDNWFILEDQIKTFFRLNPGNNFQTQPPPLSVQVFLFLFYFFRLDHDLQQPSVTLLWCSHCSLQPRKGSWNHAPREAEESMFCSSGHIHQEQHRKIIKAVFSSGFRENVFHPNSFEMLHLGRARKVQ